MPGPGSPQSARSLHAAVRSGSLQLPQSPKPLRTPHAAQAPAGSSTGSPAKPGVPSLALAPARKGSSGRFSFRDDRADSARAVSGGSARRDSTAFAPAGSARRDSFGFGGVRDGTGTSGHSGRRTSDVQLQVAGSSAHDRDAAVSVHAGGRRVSIGGKGDALAGAPPITPPSSSRNIPVLAVPPSSASASAAGAPSSGRGRLALSGMRLPLERVNALAGYNSNASAALASAVRRASAGSAVAPDVASGGDLSGRRSSRRLSARDLRDALAATAALDSARSTGRKEATPGNIGGEL